MFAFYTKNLKRLALCGLLLVVAAVAFAQENALVPGTTVTGTLDAETRAQVYTFNGAQGQVVSFVLTGETGLQLVLLLTDPSGQQLLQYADTEPSGPDTTPETTLPVSGTYFVTVFVLAGSELTEGTFQLALVTEGGPAPETTAATPAPGRAVFVQPTQVITTSGLQIALTWNTTADMNLQVRDPNGETLFWDSRATSNGGTFDFDVNGLCQVTTAQAPTERATWPAGGLATGSYEVLVFYRQSCDNSTTPVPFTVNINFNGQALPPVEGSLTPPVSGQDSVFITSFDVATDGAAAGPAGVYDLTTLPASLDELRANAQPITLAVPVNGAIVNEQPFQTYAFNATEGQFVTATMTATAGNLDTLLILLDPNGNRVDFNDDVVFGNTNSEIRDRRLQATGTYTLIASRYGKEIGGTEGNYILTVVLGESASVPQSVTDLGLPQGAIEVSMVWNTAADMQLLVRDPSGASVYDDITSIPSGGQLIAAGNVGCRPSPTPVPVSYIYWPDGLARVGTYEVEVWYQSECGQTAPVEFTLTIEVNGRMVFSDNANPRQGNRYVTNFTVNPDGSVSAGQGGIIGGSELIDYFGELPTAPALIAGQPVTGEITPANAYDVYVFDGTAGDVVTIGMTQISGTLDTKLFLIAPSGLQVAENDDVVLGEDTNSVISSFELPQDGRYVVIATRYGIQFGGTVGQYRLLLSPLN
ncbi:MAG: pre-peptidase C-terminal domain-containing protein [Chloroflexi bacterium]|nr:pre-peptidase C-terminal domain-containing protein [Chloroflexota bacterium]